MSKSYMPPAKSQEWETPQKLFDRLDEVFHFEMDVACTEENCKCPDGLFSPDVSGLGENWYGRVFCNPPYGRICHPTSSLSDWIHMAYYHVHRRKGADLALLLIPSSTEMKAWRNYIWKYAKYLIPLYGRIKFEIDGKSVGSSPKGSAIVVFSQEEIPEIYSLSDLGFVIDLEVQRRLQSGEEFNTDTRYEVGEVPIKNYIECGLIPAPEEVVK